MLKWICLFKLFSIPIFASEIKVMTFNTMCKVCDLKKEYGSFDFRLEKMAETINRHNPDLIALQEIQNRRHLKKLQSQLSNEYEAYFEKVWFWPGIDSAILIKSDRFEILETKGIWLGPKAPKFSLEWVRRLPRKIEIATLKDLTNNKIFNFFGFHFDNNNINKQKSAKILQQLVSESNIPVIAAGDSNIEPTRKDFSIFKTNLIDSYDEVLLPDFVSNHELGKNEACPDNGMSIFPDCRIDHVFYAKDSPFITKKWSVDLFYYHNNKPVSDHRAVISTLEWK